jgi:hypothetical protein
MIATERKPISDLLLEEVKGTDFDEEAMARIVNSVERYDAPFLDRVDVPTIVSVSRWGSVSLVSYYRFLTDPWSAKNYFTSTGQGDNRFFLVQPGLESDAVELVSGEDAGRVMYEHAKKAGFPPIPSFNPNVTGYMITFDELRGSVPEHMREAFEHRMLDETTMTWVQPHVNKLREWHARECDTIIDMLRLQKKRMEVKDADDPEHSEWVDVPVTKIGFGFGRFESVPDGARQSTAFFSVNDNSPDFKPDVKFNWHLQDTARWMYAGALAINFYESETDPEKRISISSNH